MDNLEKKEKTVEDVLIAGKDLDEVAGGATDYSNLPCPKCKKMTLRRIGSTVACSTRDCPFIMHVR